MATIDLLGNEFKKLSRREQVRLVSEAMRALNSAKYDAAAVVVERNARPLMEAAKRGALPWNRERVTH